MKIKLFCTLILIFISFFICKSVNGAHYEFKWLKTKIDVPYNANIYDYVDMYVVKFYVDGKESHDFYVSQEENSTTFSTVLTYIVGIYKVTYLAANDTYNVYSYQDIYFNVYDDEPPVVRGPEYIRVLVNEEIDYLSYFEVSDNCTEPDKIIINSYDQDVTYNVLGTYPLTLEFIDASNNIAQKNILIEIYDNIRPTIKVIKDLVFSYGKSYNLSEYFYAFDNYDSNPNLSIYEFDFNRLGRQNIVIEASDSSGNLIRQNFSCLVIDDINPTITLKKTSDTINIEEIDDINDLLFSYVLEMKDNYSSIEKLHLKIDSPIYEKEVGQFAFNYTVTDENGNYSTVDLVLEILEFEGPDIIGDSFEFEVGDEIDLLKLVEVNDKYDQNAKDNLEVINSNLDTSKEGEYRVLYRAYNNSGKYTVHELKIKINPKVETDVVAPDNRSTPKMGFIITFSFEMLVLLAMIVAATRKKKTL